MFPGCAIDILFAEPLKDFTVVQKLVLGNLSTAVVSPSIAVHFLLFALIHSARVASPSAASESFLRVAATPSAAFESFVHVAATQSAALANFLRVAPSHFKNAPYNLIGA